MPMRILAASAVLLALGVGCAGPSVKYDYDLKTNYTNYKTWDWYAARPGDKGEGGNAIMDARVRRAVEAELAARGFRRDPPGEPDLLVTYYASYRARQGRGHVGLGFGFGPRGLGLGVGVATSVHRPAAKAGSITLEIQDAKPGQLIWKATAEDALEDTGSPEDADADVARAVRKMLAKFPPTPRP